MFFSKLNNCSDQDLITKYKEKPNRKYIDVLYKRYSHIVFGVALKYLKNKESAEDTTISIFSSISNDIINQNITNLKAWLYTKTKNNCLNQINKKKINEISLDNLSIELGEDESSYKLDSEEKLNLVNETLNKLKPEQKKCLELFFFEKKSYEQIASEMKMDTKKIKSYIQNGKRNMKNILLSEGHFNDG